MKATSVLNGAYTVPPEWLEDSHRAWHRTHKKVCGLHDRLDHVGRTIERLPWKHETDNTGDALGKAERKVRDAVGRAHDIADTSPGGETRTVRPLAPVATGPVDDDARVGGSWALSSNYNPGRRKRLLRGLLAEVSYNLVYIECHVM